MGGPKDSILTEHRAADRRRSELVRVSEQPSGDGALEREASPEPWMLTC